MSDKPRCKKCGLVFEDHKEIKTTIPMYSCRGGGRGTKGWFWPLGDCEEYESDDTGATG